MKSITIPLIILACFFNFCTHAQIDIDTLTLAEQNKQVVLKWYERGWNNQEYKKLIPIIFAEDWTDGSPIRPDQFDGHEGMEFMVRSYFTAFPDIKFKVTHIVADEKLVAVRIETTGTHQGEIFGIEATETTINTSAMIFFEMENGKIKVTWQEIDLAGLLNQLTEKVASGK